MQMGAANWEPYNSEVNVALLPFLFTSLDNARQAWAGEFGQQFCEDVYKRQFIDYSMAGRTMMLSSERPEWDSGVLDIAGISKDKLSEPVRSTATIGRVREDIRAGFGLSRTCQVVLGGHDQACGAVGSGGVTPGMVMDACGTCLLYTSSLYPRCSSLCWERITG